MFEKKSYITVPARNSGKMAILAEQLAYDDGVCDGEKLIFARLARKCGSYNHKCRDASGECPFCIDGEVCYFNAVAPKDIDAEYVVSSLNYTSGV